MAADYRATLVAYYEEEVAGEAYFTALADRAEAGAAAEALRLLAAVERRTADLMASLLARHGLAARDETALLRWGVESAAPHLAMTWDALVDHMATTYPRYMPMFEALEAMAPAGDLPALRKVTAHEAAAIAFAERERDGDPDSTEPLRAFLAET